MRDLRVINHNQLRIINENQDLDIDWDSWEWPTIFKMIQKYGDVPINDMKRTFNLGIGMILIIDKNNLTDLDKHLKAIDEDYLVMGSIISK